MVAPRRNALSRPVWTDEGLYDGSGAPLWQPQGQYEGPDMASWIGGQVNQFATRTAPEAVKRFNWLRMGYDPQGYLADSAAAGRAGLQIGGELAASLVQPLADLYDSAANSSRYGTPMEPGPTGLNALLNAANFGIGGGAASRVAGDVGDLGMAAGRNPQAAADSALSAAIDMRAAGVPRGQVWQQTGWMQRPSDGQWVWYDHTSPLPMDDASRLDRAERIFDMDTGRTLYHGSPDVRSIDALQASGNGPAFLKTDPEKANVYAARGDGSGYGEGSGIIPVIARRGSTLRSGNTGSVKVYDTASVRSPNAAFDPRLIDSGLLLAANPDRPAQAVNALAEAGRSPEPSSSRFMNALTGGGRETPGLPMDTEARMARAVELGFNPDAMTFHGTSAPPFSAFDRSSFGSNTKGLAAQQGIFSAFDTDLATYYAETSPQGSSTGQRVLPLLHRSKRRGQIELTGDEMDHEVAATLQEAWKAGYDSVILHGYRHPGDPSKTSSVLVVRDPAQLRSPNAAFDPARKNSADLMAANPRPVGVVVGGDEKDAQR